MATAAGYNELRCPGTELVYQFKVLPQVKFSFGANVADFAIVIADSNP
jgi:hypothetical protein